MTGTWTDCVDSASLGNAAGPASPHKPGACPQQHVSSTSLNSHTGALVLGAEDGEDSRKTVEGRI